MKKIFLQLVILALIIFGAASSCTSSKKAINTTDKGKIEVSDDEKAVFQQQVNDTVKIASDSTEYEIIIIDPGFNTWLVSIARPEGFYSQSYLENRNRILVTNWNQRAMQPFNFNPNLYEMQINYNYNTDYGYEVNYKLYNYFIYFQRKYNQRLGPWLPRI